MPRALQTAPVEIDKNPEDRLGVNVHKKSIDLKAIAETQVKGFLTAVKLFTGIDLAGPGQLLESIVQGATGFASTILTALTTALGFDLPAKLHELEQAVENIPVLGDIVKALTGTDKPDPGLPDLTAWAQGLPAQAEHAAQQAIKDVNDLVGELAHDAQQVGDNLAQTIGSVLDLALGAKAQTSLNTAAITALSNIAPGKFVTPLHESPDGNDLVVFPRGWLVPIAKTAVAGDHSHSAPAGGGTTSTGGSHAHAIAADAASYQPADKELALMLVRAHRAQAVNAVKILTAPTGWSLTDLDQLVICCYALDGWTWKLVWQSTNLKDTVKTAAQTYPVPMGKELDVLPGHVLAVGVWQKLATLPVIGTPVGQTRKLAGIPLVTLASDPQNPTPTMLARLRGQASVPAQFGAGTDSGLLYLNDMAVWAALTHV